MASRETVQQFHRKMFQPVRKVPQVPPDEEVRFRARMMAEEFFEMLQALFYAPRDVDALERATARLIDDAEVDVDMVEFADAMEDLDYTVEGTRLYFGIDGGPIAAAVHAANMAKIPAPESGKALKPADWQAPDIEGALRAQGWFPPKVRI